MQTGKTSTFGRYELLTELGRGAMGVVYKAYDPKINRPVAIKTISLAASDSSEEQACRAHFLREAEAAGRLSHPGIVAVFDVGEETESLNPYIVMEYVAGRSLEDILATGDTKVPFHTTLQLIQEMAEALDYAHLQGVVHRDVKPSNILIGDDGQAKITDFGIAQVNIANRSRPGHNWGTPAYMSPEQFRGESVDGRSDLFSLGVILYRMLTGHRPFQGNSAQTVSLKVTNHDPLPATVFNTELPPELDCVITRAIAKNPTERYQTGMEMVIDLKRLQSNIDLQDTSDETPRQGIQQTGQGVVLQEVFFSPPRRPQKSEGKVAPVRFTGPWQQLGIALLTLGSLSLAFVGLWLSIPISPAPRTIGTSPSSHSDMPNAANIASHPIVEGMAQAPVVRLLAEKSARGVSLSGAHSSSDAADNSPSCQLGIAVEHHFLMADLSVWIDGQPRYNHPLRGTIKKRVALFRGVEGYLSDVLQLKPGDHNIRVRVLSADGTYDESGSISGTFAAGSQQLLAVGFDKHNRRMRLTFEVEKNL
ncbi:MAG TPA: serine/threonine-protein kinase [Candidatus Sulfotelmatobacter sp.]|jgi:serine/threonine-protein kinase|nr:serine/threonine-protein kinase [Candidatus Sulfotelmatobacter sp.]